MQQLLQDISTRVDSLAEQVVQRAQEHQILHPMVAQHQSMLTELNGRVTQLEAVGTSVPNSGNDQWRRRLDRLAEAKENASSRRQGPRCRIRRG